MMYGLEDSNLRQSDTMQLESLQWRILRSKLKTLAEQMKSQKLEKQTGFIKPKDRGKTMTEEILEKKHKIPSPKSLS